MPRLLVIAVALAVFSCTAAAQAAPELSVTNRLEDRRYVSAGDRAYVMGFEDGNFYAQGWHITGEMGGIWTQPLKLVDGIWFGIGDAWVGPATEFMSGWGYTRMELPAPAAPADLNLTRTDFAPDGRRAALIGLHVENTGAERTVSVKVDARSELMHHYPWAWTMPHAGDFNLQDTGAYDDESGALVFRDKGSSHQNAGEHDWAALVGSDRTPVAGQTGPEHWGAQGPPELCASEAQFRCDDGPFGKGIGGQLRYELVLPAGATRTLWIAVAGSDQGLEDARAEFEAARAAPEQALAAKVAERKRWARWTKLSLPADPALAEGIDWGKQNILDLTQVADDLQVRDVDEGRAYPTPLGTLERARWIGAGYPDYPWIFATDGEYTGFANVAVGQFAAIKDHARAVRDVSLMLNGNSGKVAHEVVAEGSVYFGNLQHAGNTDETAKFPSLVALIWRWTGDNGFRDEMYGFAKRNLEYIYDELDDDGDGWPEGLGNVERPGMGEEKLDNTVSTIRALFDLADMADSKNDAATAEWAREKGHDLLGRFEGAWWMPGYTQYADSLDDPGNVKVQQKHWIGVTPMEVELALETGTRPGLADFGHGFAALDEREDDCYSGTREYNHGLFHTGCGGGPTGAGERTIFSLNTAIQAVGEGNYGRLGPSQQQRYTDANTEPMFSEAWTDGTPDEQPGALPEILPSPDFDFGDGPRDANIDRCTRCRAMVMQAWGHYGTMWPVVHQQLGVRPDLGRDTLTVVPQLPPDDPPEGRTGRKIRLGSGALALVAASRDGDRYRTQIDTGSAPVEELYLGHTLPRGAHAVAVFLDGRPAGAQRRLTNRGVEVVVKTTPGKHVLEVVAG